MTWRDFFDRDHALYVSERHKLLHADLVARGVAAHIPRPDAQILDYGCGEALGAAFVSERCGKLYLFDTAPSVRAKLVAANVARPNVAVLEEAGVAAIPDASLDMIVIVSVLQYVAEAELARLLTTFHDKLKDDGKLVLADIIPKDVSPVDDARALLDFGLHGGFLIASIVGLARTALSDYRTMRAQHGLSTYDDADMRDLLADHDFTCERAAQNIGHNQKRMTFVARKVAEAE
ncbi:MAG: methyltransferase domain-containing protein [Rhodoblastus sp.]